LRREHHSPQARFDQGASSGDCQRRNGDPESLEELKLKKMAALLAAMGDSKVYNVVELAVGLNPKSRVTGPIGIKEPMGHAI